MVNSYRKDIDGLRALAVIAVVLFHLGYLRYGYLGVDVFFVISGYLITAKLYGKAAGAGISLKDFYIRRIRRIIPLLLVVNMVALGIGYYVMLPDDLENLSQSVIAANFFSNNILQYLTVNNYWNPATHLMPLMHTWSLGVEEQFYLIYPLLFLSLQKRQFIIMPFLIGLTVASVIFFGLSSNAAAVFYFLPARFFELSLGGIAAISLRDNVVSTPFKPLALIVLVVVLFVNIHLPGRLVIVVLLSLFLIASHSSNRMGSFLLENKAVVFTGKISFGIYMWHQVVLAFTRYFITDDYSLLGAALLLGIITLLSVITYYFVEQPFRDTKKIKAGPVLYGTGITVVVLTAASLCIYLKGGVVRDVPELGITAGNVVRNSNSVYNDRIYKLDADFTGSKKIKVLIIGHSFARDWANVILASKYKDSVEISYIYEIENAVHVKQRAAQAQYIYFSHMGKEELLPIATKYKIDMGKVKIIGLKDFGVNNGLIFNRRRDEGYCDQKILVRRWILKRNDGLVNEWGDKYIDIMGAVERNGAVPVFTPDCKFISQDGKHFTAYGAGYFAKLFEGSHALPFEKP